RARTADGAQQTASVPIIVGRDAPAVNPEQVWPLPEALLGGLNVAWSALGAQPISSSDGQPVAAQAQLYDEAVLPGAGFKAPAGSLPLTLTVKLAGTQPIPVAGVVLDPGGGDGSPPESPRAFDVLLSTDGQTFQPVYSGELSPFPVEQAFVFDKP